MSCTPLFSQVPRQRLASRVGCLEAPSCGHRRQDLKRCYHRNQQYSITAITDGSGAVVERYAYTAYGTPTITDASGSTRTTTAIENRYSYTGREWDESLALYHYRARLYDAVAGRFVSRDPIAYQGSEWGLFEFFDSHPSFGSDPFGEDWHHLYPFEFDDWFRANGIDIDDKSCGWEMNPVDHRALHAAGWNSEWRSFFRKYPDKRRVPLQDIIDQLQKMENDPKYFGILAKGKEVTRNYPYGYLRRNQGKLPGGGKAGKIAKMVSLLGMIVAAGNAVGATAGCCDDEQRDLEQSMQHFISSGSNINCQDVMQSLHAFLDCAGYDEIPNNLQLAKGIAEICTECP